MSIDGGRRSVAQPPIDARDFLASKSFKSSSPSAVEQPQHVNANSDHTQPRILHWTSAESRLVEYAAIDRAHSGFRGLVKQLLPRSWVRHSHRKFFDGSDDSDSVRRHRIGGAGPSKHRGSSKRGRKNSAED
ncbi:hypothetical protein DV735_g3518, partial [Chaetothyriales sp. CBS 134920]